MSVQSAKPEAAIRSPSTPIMRRPSHLPSPVFPQRAFELQLVKMWEAELGFGPVGIDDDFFELDGESVSALNILLAFEKTTGIKLIPSLLIEHPTIRALAALARANASIDDGDGIVTFRDGGSAAPVYFIPGLGGEALNARPLAMALGDDIPFYGIPNMDVATTAARDPTVEGIATNIAAVIRNANPDGPYIIAGYCVGAIFAYEVAQQLRRAGADVPLLVMIDAVNKTGFGVAERWAGRWREFRRLRSVGAGKKLRQLVRSKALSIVFRTPVFGRLIRRRHAENVYVRRFHDPNSRTIDQAYNGYWPLPYGGPVVLYASEENQLRLATDHLGWAGLTGPDFDVVDLPLAHLELLRPDSIEYFSDDLRARIIAAGHVG